MRSRRTPRGWAAILLCALVPLPLACQRVRNTTSFARVTGAVYRSPEDRTGVEGVTVYIESDSESELPYFGGDTSVLTDSTGAYGLNVFLGFTVVDQGEGPVFDPDVPTFVADARMLFFYQDMWYDFGGGVTIEMGQTFTMPDVFLSQFLGGAALPAPRPRS